MGMYRFTFEAFGGHGCERQITRGKIFGCGMRSCPDCEIREFVQRMRDKGQKIKTALLEHDPDFPDSVKDDLLTRTRSGQF
jgi:hypothetical protein